MTFRNHEESHAHSLQTLNTLFEYDDFMESIGTLVDLGCGAGLDLEWWATCTTRDEPAVPLNIQCTGIDIVNAPPLVKKYSNITYQKLDFENLDQLPEKTRFDVLWCHNAFQYCIDPLAALAQWNRIAEDGGMLIMAVPQTTNIDLRQLSFTQSNGCYYHHTVVSLMHMLAVTGWDCKSGFFKKDLTDNFVYVIAYKSTHAPMPPKTTTWYELAEKGLLPDTAAASVQKHGYVRQQDLVLSWIDKSLSWLGQQ